MHCKLCSGPFKPEYHLDTNGMCPFTMAPVVYTEAVNAVPEPQDAYFSIPDSYRWAFNIEMARKRHGNILVTGPSGCGKTEIAKFLSTNPTVINCAAMTTAAQWGGERSLVEQNGVVVTTFTPSRFVMALERSGEIILDEFNRVPDAIRNLLLALMDGQRTFENPITHQLHFRHDECMIIMTANIGYEYSGTMAIDPAFISRSRRVTMDYPSQAEEVRIVQSRHPIDAATLSTLIRFANNIRSKKAEHPTFPNVGTRDILDIAEAISLGAPLEMAMALSVMANVDTTGGVSSTYAEIQSIWVASQEGN